MSTENKAASLEDINASLLHQPAAAPAQQHADELLKIALGMLAGWCVSVDHNGTSWDDWDESYKSAMYRPGPLRALLDAAIKQERVDRGIDAAGQEDGAA